MLREDGLLLNLTAMFQNWILPQRPAKKKKKKKSWREVWGEKGRWRYMSWDYYQNNGPLLAFIGIFVAVNCILFIQRGVYFKDFSMLSGFKPNLFYMTSRGLGRTLLLNSVLILVLVLRYTMTTLRKFGWGRFLPIDHNIYLHKLVGTVICVQGLVHSVMHFLNLAINIQPDPVRFLQLTSSYWVDLPDRPLFGYQIPPGCLVVDTTTRDSNLTALCSSQPHENITLCQVCPTGTEWSYVDWIFTLQPGMFGLLPGCANPTGVGLLVCLTVMFLCSLPVVRRSGHFQVFYTSHMLYIAYFILLIFHAPSFWKWFVFPASIWLCERIYRLLSSSWGKGKTYISAGVLLPSRVTNLIIRKPDGFTFSPGDWIFIKIPAVAATEWHPFTISSAPEVEGEFTLHIRGVGGWTNKLYQLFEDEYIRQCSGAQTHVSTIGKLYGTMKRRLTKQGRRKTEIDPESFILATDLEKQQDRMNKRMEHLNLTATQCKDQQQNQLLRRSLKKVRYLSMNQKIIQYEKPSKISAEAASGLDCTTKKKEVGRTTLLTNPVVVHIDGPFGSPSSNIYRAEHAVLIGTGIGVTPFASILQSIIHRYLAIKQTCPNCSYQWTNMLENSMQSLKKVDFFWINRDQKSFEWFVNLLSQLEMEQAVQGGEMARFLAMHMYVTSAWQRTDMKAVSLQLALDILHKREERDLITGLKSRTHAGRPNWDLVFSRLREEGRGEVTVFYCGNQALGRVLRLKAEQFGFRFSKEVF